MVERAEDFLRYQEHIKHAPATTLRAYRGDLARLEDFTREGIRRVLAAEWGKVKPSTTRRRLDTYRSFGRWLERFHDADHNPARAVRSPKQEHRLPESRAVDDVFRGLELPDQATPLGARDKALMETLYSTGCRVAEVVALDVGDLAGDGAKVVGKGAKERWVMLGLARFYVDLWLLHRPYLCGRLGQQHSTALFVNQKGSRLDQRSARRVVHQWLGCSPHKLRYSCASHMRNDGADLMVLKELLGHSSLSTTAKYLEVGIEQLQREYRGAHPRAKRGQP
jgi:integrase/recombinase XerC